MVAPQFILEHSRTKGGNFWRPLEFSRSIELHSQIVKSLLKNEPGHVANIIPGPSMMTFIEPLYNTFSFLLNSTHLDCYPKLT